MARKSRFAGSVVPGLLVLATVTLAARVGVAAELGAIFYTPQERRALEAQLAGVTQSPDQDGGQGQAQATAMIHFNGLIRRSSGPTTAWVDGRHLGPGAIPAHTTARLVGNSLELTRNGSRKVLRPGERETMSVAPVAEAAESDSKPVTR
ncbi:MAG: hypothetical protein R3E83_09985 [Burkholderiaceae bacterium]